MIALFCKNTFSVDVNFQFKKGYVKPDIASGSPVIQREDDPRALIVFIVISRKK